MNYLVTIITINFNNHFGLERTLTSIFSQTWKGYELVVIDGGSTDGSLKLIKQYSEKITYWVSESDKGIYDAQNKGANKASGKYLLFLNSGDELFNGDILKNVVDWLSDSDIVYGNLQIVEPTLKWIKRYDQNITFSYFLKDTLPHQASFISRGIFDKCGGQYDSKLKFVGDWKFFMDAVCKFGASIKYLDQIVASYDYGGISSLPESEEKMIKEKDRILKLEYYRFYKDFDDILKFRNLSKKYNAVTSSKFVRAYFWFRNLVTIRKIKL